MSTSEQFDSALITITARLKELVKEPDYEAGSMVIAYAEEVGLGGEQTEQFLETSVGRVVYRINQVPEDEPTDVQFFAIASAIKSGIASALLLGYHLAKDQAKDDALQFGANLLSYDDEHPEYDRAILDLVADLIGYTESVDSNEIRTMLEEVRA